MSATTLAIPAVQSRAVKIASWTLQILAGAAFIAAGSAKIAGAQMMVDIFNQVGVGQWFRVVTGVVEVVGGIAVLIPAVAGFGGLLLATTMFFAVLTHLFVIGGNPAPAIVLFLVTASIAWLRRGSIAAVVGGHS